MSIFDNYLNDFKGLSESEFFKIHNLVNSRKLRKNEPYFELGTFQPKIFYVKKGILRGFVTTENGDDKTIFFRWQKEFGADPDCFFNKAPARYSWAALEDTEILEINFKQLQN